MHIAQRRTERNHVHARIARGKLSALQSSVNATHNGFFVKQSLVRFDSQFGQFAVRVHLPSRVSVRLFHFGASQLQHGANGVTLVGEVAHYVAALRSKQVYGVVGGFHHSDIARSLNHSAQSWVLADGKHAIGYALKGHDDTATNIGRHYLFGISTFHSKLHGGVGNVEFVGHFVGENVPIGTHILLHVVGNGYHNTSVAWYGVVQLARIKASQAHVVFFLFQVNKSCKQLNGVGAFLVDVVARVSASKSLNRNLQEEMAFGRFFFFEMEYGMCAASACTRNEYLSFVF